MELLELALKHSIDWSMKARQSLNIGPRSRYLDEVDIADESHVRAFVTHFKIELNKLMGLKRQHSPRQSNPEKGSLTEQDSFNSDEDESLPFVTVQCANGNLLTSSTSTRMPRIETNGKYCGLYNINEQTIDDENYFQVEVEQIDKQRKHSKGKGRSTRRHAKFENSEDDFGYGSLSRESFKSHPDLIQQLHELRSRLIDLAQEIDESVERRLNEEELESYRRRRDALMSKIDSLIECYDLQFYESSPVLIGLTDSESNEDNPEPSQQLYQNLAGYSSRVGNTFSIKENKSKPCSCPHEYEEQVHVIDYNYTRRLSDFADPSSVLQVQTDIELRKLRREELNSSDDFIPFRDEPMMSKQESSKEEGQIGSESSKTTIAIESVTQHVPSSSSTSNSSSSSFL